MERQMILQGSYSLVPSHQYCLRLSPVTASSIEGAYPLLKHILFHLSAAVRRGGLTAKYSTLRSRTSNT
jgi:hypothetical protein